MTEDQPKVGDILARLDNGLVLQRMTAKDSPEQAMMWADSGDNIIKSNVVVIRIPCVASDCQGFALARVDVTDALSSVEVDAPCDLCGQVYHIRHQFSSNDVQVSWESV
jgi:hypothetical protein